MLDGLVPLLIEEVEACGEGLGCSLVEVVDLLAVEAVRDERKPLRELLVDGGIDLGDGITRVLGVERLLGRVLSFV